MNIKELRGMDEHHVDLYLDLLDDMTSIANQLLNEYVERIVMIDMCTNNFQLIMCKTYRYTGMFEITENDPILEFKMGMNKIHISKKLLYDDDEWARQIDEAKKRRASKMVNHLENVFYGS